MDKLFIRIFKILSYVIILAGVVMFVLVLMNADSLETDLAIRDKIMNPFINLTLVTIIITAAGALVFPVIYIARNPKGLVKFLIILAVLVVLGFVAYSMATNAFSVEDLQRLKTTEEESRIVGAGLIFTYFIGGLTILALFVSSVLSFFKR